MQSQGLEANTGNLSVRDQLDTQGSETPVGDWDSVLPYRGKGLPTYMKLHGQ